MRPLLLDLNSGWLISPEGGEEDVIILQPPGGSAKTKKGNASQFSRNPGATGPSKEKIEAVMASFVCVFILTIQDLNRFPSRGGLGKG